MDLRLSCDLTTFGLSSSLKNGVLNGALAQHNSIQYLGIRAVRAATVTTVLTVALFQCLINYSLAYVFTHAHTTTNSTKLIIIINLAHSVA